MTDETKSPWKTFAEEIEVSSQHRRDRYLANREGGGIRAEIELDAGTVR